MALGERLCVGPRDKQTPWLRLLGCGDLKGEEGLRNLMGVEGRDQALAARPGLLLLVDGAKDELGGSQGRGGGGPGEQNWREPVSLCVGDSRSVHAWRAHFCVGGRKVLA